MFNGNYRSCGCMKNKSNTMQTDNSNSMNSSIIDNSCSNFANDEFDMQNCECGFSEPFSAFPENPTIAESYVPIQRMNDVFKRCVGLKMGTMFPELVSNYEPGQSMAEIAYLRETNKIGEGCNKCQ